MSQAWLCPPASSTSATSSQRTITTRRRVWLQPAASVTAAKSSRAWMSPAASSSGRTQSTATKRMKLQRDPSRSFKRPRLLPRAVTRTSRDWICPSSGNFACIREARLDMTAVLMATRLASSRTVYSAKSGDPARLKKLYRAGISSRHTK